MKKLSSVMKKNLSYNPKGKAAFHRTAKAALTELAKALGLREGEYDLRSNQGGIAVSGEVILHGDQLYVQVSQSVLGPGSEILYRKCRGRNDYTGFRNHFAPANMLDPENIPLFATQLQQVIAQPW